MNKRVRTISAQLHVWLGLLSGIVVFIVCITGCMYVFKDEINDLTQPWKFVQPQPTSVLLLPSQVLGIAQSRMPDALPTALTYGEGYDAVFVDYYQPQKGIRTVYINPYSGQVIKTITHQKGDFDFFSFVLQGHRTLWLPREIGKPVVGYGILLFLITLLTGIVLWWPKRWTKYAAKKNFTIQWRSPFSRLNYHLHNVLGGYAALVLIALSFTGLIWSFPWFSKAVYSVTSGGEVLKPYTLPQSDTLSIANPLTQSLDALCLQLRSEEPDAKTFYFALPNSATSAIRVSIVHKRGSYYQTDNLFYDQYTLAPLQGSGPYAGKYKQASTADKIRRMNLEIHDGRIGGLFGKALVFLAALIGASLPVTGFIIWYQKHKKKFATRRCLRNSLRRGK